MKTSIVSIRTVRKMNLPVHESIYHYHAIVRMRRMAAWKRIKKLSDLVNLYRDGVLIHKSRCY